MILTPLLRRRAFSSTIPTGVRARERPVRVEFRMPAQPRGDAAQVCAIIGELALIAGKLLSAMRPLGLSCQD